MASKFGKHYPVLSRSNERERMLFVAAAGLACSLIIILVVLFNFKQPGDADEGMSEVAPPPAVLGTITLLTPERAVRQGTSLADVRMKEVYWPRNQVPQAAIRDLSETRNMFAKVNLTPGVPLQRDHLTADPVESVLQVSPGNRAVTIHVDEVTGMEGHAQPGSRVDVVLTYYEQRELTSKVIVQNARVLSLGGNTESGGTGRSTGRVRSYQARTITLDVAPKDALEIQTAKKLGTLSLMMRHIDDASPIVQDEMTQSDIGDNRGRAKRQRRVCKKGTVRISGDEFIMNCDGTLTKVADPYEP